MSVTSAAALTLPTPQCGLAAGDTCLNFDAFTVYSLALLQWKETGDVAKPQDKYYVASSSLNSDLVVISRNGGAQADNTDLKLGDSVLKTGVDDAYEATKPQFLMLKENEPDQKPDGADFIGDNITNVYDQNTNLSLWDISISALNKFLDDKDFVMYFNLNEENFKDQNVDEIDDGTMKSGQDLLGWMTVYLTDLDDEGKIVKTEAFTLSGLNGIPGVTSQEQTTNVDSILPQISDSWAYVHGQICVGTGGAVVHFGACSGSEGTTVNQNLGENAAAFALWNEELNKLIKSGEYDVLSVDARLSHLGNGPESLFIRATTVGNDVEPVPEPATMLLFGAGLSGLGLIGSRARRKK